MTHSYPPHAPFLLHRHRPDVFPDTALALREPNGLLAIGGDLCEARLLAAYQRGIFPWYNEGQPILWWSPDPRTVLYPASIKVSRSLKKSLRRNVWQVTADHVFNQVIEACRQPRPQQPDTWITSAMLQAYCRLHQAGYAHSIEVWCDGELCGGLYGVSLGRVFFGESMFSQRSDGSKIALLALCRQLQRWQFSLIDCQVASAHLASLGAQPLPRDTFNRCLQLDAVAPHRIGCWQFDDDLLLHECVYDRA